MIGVKYPTCPSCKTPMLSVAVVGMDGPDQRYRHDACGHLMTHDELVATEKATNPVMLVHEPLALLAVVEDDRGRQWYRWAAGTAHTHYPWTRLGDVHADTVSEEHVGWADLPAVFLVSPGVDRPGVPAEAAT